MASLNISLVVRENSQIIYIERLVAPSPRQRLFRRSVELFLPWLPPLPSREPSDSDLVMISTPQRTSGC